MTADTTTTPQMNLTIGVPSVRVGPSWATDLVTLAGEVDTHTHVAGQGSKIPPGGLTMTADLDFNPTGGTTGQSATNLRSTRFLQLASAPATASDIRAAYSYGSPGDLYWKDGAGTEIQITSGGLLNSAALTNNSWTRSAFSTNITILSSDTPVYYDGDTSGAARTVTLPRCNAVAGKFYLFRQTTGTNGIVLAPNAADSIDGLSAGTSLTLPAAAARGEWLIYSDGQTAGKWSVIRSSQDLNGAAVPAALGALVTGNTLQVTGVSTLAYQALNLAGGANFVTGALPGTNMATATTTTTGAIQLGTDFGTSGTAPTVVGLTGVSGVVSFGATVTTPTIRQTILAAAGSANALTLAAQASPAGGGSVGGNLVLQSGSDGSATEASGGDILFKRGAVTALQLTGTTGTVTASVAAATASGAGTALVLQAQAGVSSGAGGSASFAGGAGTGTNKAGGAANIVGGANTGSGLKGSVSLILGNADTLVHVKELVTGRRAVGLGFPSGISSSNLGSGDGFVLISDAVTNPSTAPSGGAALFCDAGVSGMLTIYTGASSAFGIRGATTSASALGSFAKSVTVYIDGTPYRLPLYN